MTRYSLHHRCAAIFVLVVGLVSTSSLSEALGEIISTVTTHAYGGAPSTNTINIRNGYVVSFDHDGRIPRWVAYRVTPAYLDVPKREGRYAKFHVDESVPNSTHPNDYKLPTVTRGGRTRGKYDRSSFGLNRRRQMCRRRRVG